MENFTIPVPNGTTNHGNPNLICTPVSFSSLFIFFATNYFAHAVTVKQLPGEQLNQYFFAVLAAVIYPYCGLPRGVESIIRRAIFFRKNELQTACRAGALCIVVRSRGWKPMRGQKPVPGVYLPPAETGKSEDRASESDGLALIQSNEVELGEVGNSSALPLRLSLTMTHDNLDQAKLPRPSEGVKRRQIHGVHFLPNGYQLAIIPDNTKIVPNADVNASGVHLSSSYNLAQVIVSLIQLVSSSITLYRARGDQLDRYGYAAFGLTVLPYITMSVVNFVGNMLTPNYQSVYLVNSAELEEAKERGGKFDGTVGKIVQLPSLTSKGKYSDIATFQWDSNRKTVIVKVSNPRSQAAEAEQSWEVDALDEVDVDYQEYWEDGNHELPNDHGKFPYMDILSRPYRYSAGQSLAIPRCAPFEISGKSTMNDPLLSGLVLIFFVIPYVVIGGLTHFRNGGSTAAQRVWIMIWLVFDTLFAYWAGIPDRLNHDDRVGFIIMLCLAAPGVGGFVVVGQMLMHYGNCRDIGSGI